MATSDERARDERGAGGEAGSGRGDGAPPERAATSYADAKAQQDDFETMLDEETHDPTASDGTEQWQAAVDREREGDGPEESRPSRSTSI